MNRYFFFPFLFLLCQKSSAAAHPVDTLLKLTEPQQLGFMHTYYENKMQYADSAAFFRTVDRIKELGARYRKDKRLEIWPVIFTGYYYEDHVDQPEYAEALGFYTEALAMARRNQLKFIEPEIMHRMAVLLYNNKKYEEAFHYMMYAREKIEDIGYGIYPNTARFLGDLGFYYLDFNFYEEAIVNLRAAIQYEFTRFDVALYCYKSLGNAYEGINNIDSALYFYEKTLNIAREMDNILWIGKLSYQIGNIYYAQNKIEQALPLLREGYRLSMETAAWCTAANALIVQAEFAMDEGRSEAARRLLYDARMLAIMGPERLTTYRDLYNSYARFYRLKQDPARALLYQDSFLLYKDSIVAQRDALLLRDSEIKAKIERQQSEIVLLKSEKKRQILLRNTIVLASFLVIIIGIMMLRQVRQKRQKDRVLLLSYVESLREKSLLVERFKSELEHVHAEQGQPVSAEKVEILQQLRESTILTEQDWKEFRILFDKVHKGFFIRLQEKYPALSQAEIRLLALIRLNLSGREIADMLGISPESVRKTRQRVRERLDITEVKLEDFVKDV